MAHLRLYAALSQTILKVPQGVIVKGQKKSVKSQRKKET